MTQLETANTLLRQGRVVEALRVYSRIESTNGPISTAVQFNMGLAERRLKRAASASIDAPEGSTNGRDHDLQEAEKGPSIIDQIPLWTREYLDPTLRLPALVGLGNDYSHFETQAGLLATKEDWQVLKLSIIVPVFERGNALRKTLACLTKQTYPKNLTEVILVDDGSIDENIENVFHEFAPRLNLYLARQERNGYGLSRARNLGARMAKGDVLLFLDGDILLPVEFVEAVMRYHHVTQACSVMGIRKFVDARDVTVEELLTGVSSLESIRRCDPGNPHHLQHRNEAGECEDWRLRDLRATDWLKKAVAPFRFFGGGHSSVSKERFFKVGGFSEDFNAWGNEDQEFAYRLWSIGQYFVPLRDHFDFHQEDIAEEKAQNYKLEENKLTHELLRDKCPHFAVRPLGQCVRNYAVPLFSIYVPAFNVENYIEDCIESVLAQTYSDFEVVVVDDGSTDATLIRLKRYQGDSRVRIFSKPNGGIGSASNYAIKRARGEYIVQLDADDMLLANALESLANFFSADGSIEAVYSRHDLIDASGRRLGAGWAEKQFNRYQNLIGMCVPHLRAFRRGLYYRTSGFDEKLENAVDYDFFLKLSQVAGVRFLDKTLYLYRIHSKQTSFAKADEQLRNHESVVGKFLTTIGLSEFYARRLNPFEPQKNYVLKRGSDFEKRLLSNVFESKEAPALTLPRALSAGNDYSAISAEIERIYRGGAPHYSEKVSIIVPVYNRAERLARCLAGICHQKYPRDLIEVVVVDDGSSDEVVSVIKKYSQLLNLKFVKQVDAGFRLSAARNLGIRTASYPNISIIDCDLIPLPGFIEAFMKYLHHFDNVVLLGHQRFVDPGAITDDQILQDVSILNGIKDIKSENSTVCSESEVTQDWRYKLYDETEYLKRDEFPYRAFSSGHVAYKRKLIEAAGYYDEEFKVWGCEDNEAGYRLYRNGAFFIPVLEAVDLHQEPPGGRNETDREAHRLISRALLQAKVPAMRGWFGAPYLKKQSDMPLVSVCMPVRNTGELAILAAQSALSQTLNDLEVVIYDDASEDGTLKLLQNAFRGCSEVRIIEGREHVNVARARRRLIEAARGEFVGFLDSDDLLRPQAVERCVETFRANPKLGLVCTLYDEIDERGAVVRAGWVPPQFDREALMLGNIFTHFRMFRARDWSRSRKWTDAEVDSYLYGEDWDLCLKLAEVSDFARVNEPLYQYRKRNSSITNSSDFAFKATNTRRVMQAWADRIAEDRFEVVTVSLANPSAIGYTSAGRQVPEKSRFNLNSTME